MTLLYQVGLISAFLKGVNESEVTCAQLSQHGDTGLGTFNQLNGEMVTLDGIIYRIDEYGDASIASPNMRTPYALITQFQPTDVFDIFDIKNLTELSQLIDEHLPTKNIFYMIRIDGEFSELHVRSEACQFKSGLPLSETLPQLQTNFYSQKSHGTLIVTSSPQFSAGFTIPGYHYHYINSKRTSGGHVFALQVTSAKVQISPIRSIQLELFASNQFDQMDLDCDVVSELKKIELGDKYV